MLDSEEAARRLGVKVSTIYAYVSRGFLTSQPASDGRRSLFDEAEIQRLRHRSRGTRQAVGQHLQRRSTDVTQLTEQGPLYRGHPAVRLATECSFEEVAALLWKADDGPWQPVHLGSPPELAARDLLHWAVVMAGSRDPLRSDMRIEAVIRSARRLIASLVAVVPPASRIELREDESSGSIAAALAARLCETSVTPEVVQALSAALILYADHETGMSTLAVRAAASVRANVYDATLAGLCTLIGVLGVAAGLVRNMLLEAERHGARRAVDEALRVRAALPGFGHVFYEKRDPRADVLLGLVERCAGSRYRTVHDLIETTRDYELPPNLDFAVGALLWAARMPQDSGQIIFAIARVTGWIAHYLEELAEPPGRFRSWS